MANQLDLEEQEQLDELKAFWKRYGNLITIVLTVALAAFASWNFYQRWQQSQASQAAALFDEVERNAVAGDLPKLERAFADMKDKYPSTSFAQQAGLVAARVFFEGTKSDQAKAALTWVAEKSSDAGYQAIAKLRLAGVLAESAAYDDALKLLSGSFPAEFSALVSDRTGDIYMLQGKKAEARAEFEKAFKAFDERAEYRRLVEVKLNSLGVNPKPVIPEVRAEGSK
jgi:predicted negative regulator of RcsB-dependent stress response